MDFSPLNAGNSVRLGKRCNNKVFWNTKKSRVYPRHLSIQKLPTMDYLFDPSEVMALASTLLLLLLSTNQALDLPCLQDTDDNSDNLLQSMTKASQQSTFDMETVMRAALHTFRLCNVFSLLEDDLGYWVKPRSTIWFSRFLLDQYDDERWITISRMTKPAVFHLAALLKPKVQKKDTKYRLSIPVLIRVACTLFKLTHGASLFICNEMFAIGRSTVSLVLRDVVEAINLSLRSEISWPTGEKLLETKAGFQQLCGLLGVLGAIDGTHVSICKPKNGPGDYFYFKSGGYTLNCQAVVDSNKHFLDLFFGMLGSTNDARMLRRSSLYQKRMHGTLWNSAASFHGFSPYLLTDLGYPLLPWTMVPHRGQGNLPIADTLFNKKLRRDCGVVENAFGILKQSFRELLVKSNLQVTFLPDVILCCAILHNILLGQSHEQVERLLQVLKMEGLNEEDDDEQPVVIDAGKVVPDDCAFAQGMDKRWHLGVFLALERNIAM